MQSLTKLSIAVFLATIVTLTTGFSPARKTDSHTPVGKPRPPMSIEAEAVRPVEPGSEVTVQFTLVPQTDCSDLTVRLRGLDGVEVQDSEVRRVAGCRADQPLQITGRARVPAKTRGSVVIDVTFRGPSGESATSRSVPVISSDAVKLKRESDSQHRVDVNSEERMTLLPAETR